MNTSAKSVSRTFAEKLTQHPIILPITLFVYTFAGQGVRYLIGWAGFSVVAIILATVTIYSYRKTFTQKSSLKFLPLTLGGFLLWSTMSATWSEYTSVTLLGVAIQLITTVAAYLLAVNLSWEQILFSLTIALQIILASSFAIEALAAFIIQGPINPLVDGTPGFYWVDGNLINGLPVQGIVGNRNLLGFVALISLISIIGTYAVTKRNAVGTLAWSAAAVAAVILTDSATVTLSLVALIVLLAVVLFMRKVRLKSHRYAYYGIGTLLLGGLTAAVVYSSSLFALVGRSDDMSGRNIVWSKVITLIQEHPVIGWGWTGYWAPWVEPFKGLVVVDGTTYLQAHNALLDIFLQLGAVGAVLAVTAAIIGAARAWRFSVAPTRMNAPSLTWNPIAVIPVLLLAALFIQSLTESRLLIEGNWLLLVIILCKVKADAPEYGSLRTVSEKAGKKLFGYAHETVNAWNSTAAEMSKLKEPLTRPCHFHMPTKTKA